MTESDALLTVAEIALGVAGFTGVVTVFGRRPGGWFYADRIRLQIVLDLSVSVLVLALVGVGLELAGVRGPRLSAVLSGLMLTHAAVSISLHTIRAKRYENQYGTAITNPAYQTLIYAASAVNLLAQLANVVGVPFGRHFTIFFFGLIWQLLVALMQFIRVLFIRPPDDESAA